MDIKEKINSLPLTCGVYLFKDLLGKIIYIGKAVSLKKRVKSYFTKNAQVQSKGNFISEIADIDYIPCDSEAKAFILEELLIKENKPKYNVVSKDDKSLPYIEITKETFPLVKTARNKKDKSSLYFGPYSNSGFLKEALTMIRQIFPFRTCLNLPKKVCLYYHIGLCPGPCVGHISRKQYNKNIKDIVLILQGKRKKLLKSLRKDMELASLKLEFEKAAVIRDKYFSILNLYGLNREYSELFSLKNFLKLKKIPSYIEAVDISNTSGRFNVGSLIVFKDGMPSKNDYRRFRIKTVVGSDDYSSMRELIRRRYQRLLDEKSLLPNIIIVDGGKAQVAAAWDELVKLGLRIPVFGIAKKKEIVFTHSKLKPLNIPLSSPAMKLIQKIRDEAHRFAHKYHLLLRQKGMYETD